MNLFFLIGLTVQTSSTNSNVGACGPQDYWVHDSVCAGYTVTTEGCLEGAPSDTLMCAITSCVKGEYAFEGFFLEDSPNCVYERFQYLYEDTNIVYCGYQPNLDVLEVDAGGSILYAIDEEDHFPGFRLCPLFNLTQSPTLHPTTEPTGDPTGDPTAEPTNQPTAEPTGDPTAEPTGEPTGDPTAEPTREPTSEPTGEPTGEPTSEPTGEPTAEPTSEPTGEPTAEPTSEPTGDPTGEPTAEPTTESTDIVEQNTTTVTPSLSSEAPTTGDTSLFLPETVNTDESESSSSISDGAIAGIVIGGLVGVAAVVYAGNRLQWWDKLSSSYSPLKKEGSQGKKTAKKVGRLLF